MHAQDDQNMRILRMFEGTFSLDEVPMIEEIISQQLHIYLCEASGWPSSLRF